jgi:rhodanese-related sulfurtransferase
MKSGLRHHSILTGFIFFLVVVVPLLAYWLVVGRAPNTEAAEARELAAKNEVVFVYVGKLPLPDSMAKVQAFRWPLDELLRVRDKSDIPSELRNRQMMFVCSAGISSALAASHLRGIGAYNASSMRGGLQAYIAAVPGCSASALLHADPAADSKIAAFRPSSLFEQWAAVLAFFGLKGVYSILAIWIIVLLWRKKEADLAALRWAMIMFSAGEFCCFLNVMAFFEDSVFLEHMHSTGMVLSLSLIAYAFLEGLDSRVIHCSDEKRCAIADMCGACIKYSDTICGMRRLFLCLMPAIAVLAVIPLFSPFRMTVYNTRILGLLHSYRHPVIHQLYEIRFLPVAALILLAGGFVVLRFCERRTMTVSKLLFSSALGAIGFSYFRLFLSASFIDAQVWFAFWEEMTELIFIAIIGGTLLVFSRNLGISAVVAQNGLGDL